MCNQALTWAFKQKLPGPLKFLLVALAEMAGKDGQCYPSQSALADRCSTTRPNICRRLKELGVRGFIQAQSFGNGKINTYTVLCDCLALPVPERHTVCRSDTPVPAEPVPERQATCATAALEPVPERHTEPLVEPLREPLVVPPPIVPPPPAGRGKKPRRGFPSDWQPDEQDIEFALGEDRSFDWIDREGQRCRDHHLSKGNLFADLHATWRTWVRNAPQFEHQRTRAYGKQNSHDAETAAFEFVSRGFSG